MKTPTILAVTLVGASLVVLLPAAAVVPQELKKQDDARVQILKNEIYTTSAEAGFKKRLEALFRSQDDKPLYPYSYDLREIFSRSRSMGASNIFLVRGNDAAAAVNATRLVFATRHSADRPPLGDIYGKAIKSKQCWLVVYLGSSHSQPPYWKFKFCSFTGNTIEFTYELLQDTGGDPMGSTTDGIQYFYWVPLPRLARGTYELKLVEARTKQPRLIRYVEFP